MDVDKIAVMLAEEELKEIIDDAYLDRSDWQPFVEKFSRRLIARLGEQGPVGRVEHREDTTQYGLLYTHLPKGAKLYAAPVLKGSVEVPEMPDAEHLKAGVNAFQHARQSSDSLDDWRAFWRGVLQSLAAAQGGKDG